MRWNGQTVEQWRASWEPGRRCFAWLPVQLSDGAWVWLEPYWAAGVPWANEIGEPTKPYQGKALTQEGALAARRANVESGKRPG